MVHANHCGPQALQIPMRRPESMLICDSHNYETIIMEKQLKS